MYAKVRKIRWPINCKKNLIYLWINADHSELLQIYRKSHHDTVVTILLPYFHSLYQDLKSQTISLSGWLTIVSIYKHGLHSFMKVIYFPWRFCFLRYVHVFILLKLPIFKKWQDDRLIWTPASYGDIDMIFTAPSKIWKPEIIVENSLVLTSVHWQFC